MAGIWIIIRNGIHDKALLFLGWQRHSIHPGGVGAFDSAHRRIGIPKFNTLDRIRLSFVRNRAP